MSSSLLLLLLLLRCRHQLTVTPRSEKSVRLYYCSASNSNARMTKVSSGKPKRGPPKHANTYAFHHNPSSRLTAHILSLPINDLCPPCVAVIEWRKKYRKYKPLTVMKKCTACGEKRIKEAYHVICAQCCRKGEGQCAKCLLPPSQWKAKNAAGSEVGAEAEDKEVDKDELEEDEFDDEYDSKDDNDDKE